MFTFGKHKLPLKSITVTTDAEGNVTDRRLRGRTFMAFDEGGLPLNNGLGVTLNYTTGTIETGDARVRNIEVIYL